MKKTLEPPRPLSHLVTVTKFLKVLARKPQPAVTVPIKREHGAKRMRFDAAMLLDAPGVKSFSEVKDAAGKVTDYRDVSVKGYLSTFGGQDRIGDVVLPGAFKDTIPTFMRNPRLQVDHRNSAEYTVGSFTKVAEDAKGLYVEAVLSNSPGEVASDIRFKVAEGHIKALSMGGYFHYLQDGRTIEKVDLYEGSLVAVPMNPEAMISIRELTAEDEKNLGQRQAV